MVISLYVPLTFAYWLSKLIRQPISGNINGAVSSNVVRQIIPPYLFFLLTYKSMPSTGPKINLGTLSVTVSS